MSSFGDEALALVQTKLAPPALGRDLVARPHLVERLNRGMDRKLTLISAMAGAGKSTLMTQWLLEHRQQTAWLSLDQNDNQLLLFAGYLCSAIQTVYPDNCGEVLDFLDAQMAPPPRVITASLVNELASLCMSAKTTDAEGRNVPALIIALDDYHHIRELRIHELVEELITYLPDNVHLVISTRTDPPMPLAGLRASGQMAELRTGDLQFNRQEALVLIATTTGQSVNAKTADVLNEMTEGWAAGLRLAALSIRDAPDVNDLATRLGDGGTDMTADYLANEVLSHQSPALQQFMLRTSILTRFTAELCDDIVIDRDDSAPASAPDGSLSREFLKEISAKNLFLFSLDQTGQWFRYHHLFQDLLQHRLHSLYDPEYIKTLHGRASRWYEDNGFIEEALSHAFSAGDLDGAAGIVARKRHELINQTRWQRLSRYLDRFPEKYVCEQPDLLMLRAWLLYHDWRYDLLPAALVELAEVMGQSALEPEVARRLEAEASAQASLLSYFSLDPDRTIAQAHFAIDNTPPEAWNVRILARLTLAGAYQMKGDLDRACRAILGAGDEETTKDERLQATALMASCYVYWMAADLNCLAQVADHCLAILKTRRANETERLAHYHLGCVQLYRNNLAEAERHFAVATNQPHRSYGECYVFSAVGLARALWAQNRLDEARATIEATVSFILDTGNMALLQVARAFEIELALREGNLEVARQWAASFDSDRPLMPMPYLFHHEFTLIRVWLIQDTRESRQRADDLLGRMRHYAESFHNKIVLINVLLLSGLLHDARSNRTLALAEVQRAVDLAQPGGIIWPFVDLGPPMAVLLRTLRDQGVAAGQIDRMLDFFPNDESAGPKTEGDVGWQPSPQGNEVLTARQLDVLDLLAQRLSNKEIAEILFISPATVKTHTLNIYAKLDASGRQQAVKKAHEIGLLSPNQIR